jgi:uncharacterized coiled-coil protein SlyX
MIKLYKTENYSPKVIDLINELVDRVEAIDEKLADQDRRIKEIKETITKKQKSSNKGVNHATKKQI